MYARQISITIALVVMASAGRAEDIDWNRRAERKCGVNSLYMLFKLCGQPVDYSKLESQVDVGPNGSTMLELRDAARRIGVNAEVYRCRDHKLPPLRGPAIAHFRTSPNTRLKTGHYVVVLGVQDDGRIDLLEGSFGLRKSCDPEKFFRQWSGYLIVVDDGRTNWPLAMAAGVATVVGVIFWRGRRRVLPRMEHAHEARVRMLFDKLKLAKIMFGALAAVALWSDSVCSATEPRDTSAVPQRIPLTQTPAADAWRVQENDGVTCLYLLLRGLGHDLSPDDIMRSHAGSRERTSFLDLANTARRLSTRLEAYSCGPEELARIDLPVIAMIEGVRGGSTFVLILGVSHKSVSYVAGAIATIEQMPADEFRRRFSGYVLAPSRRSDVAPTWLIGGVCLLGTYFWLSCRRGRKSSES